LAFFAQVQTKTDNLGLLATELGLRTAMEKSDVKREFLSEVKYTDILCSYHPKLRSAFCKGMEKRLAELFFITSLM
jgi:hypothetical protein